MQDGNRRGILAGLDYRGAPLAPVKYRPVDPKTGRPIKGKGARLTAAQKLGVKGRGRGKFAGKGLWASGLHNNLTPGEYQLLGGPPLAPRAAYSRVITNFVTDYAKLPSGDWQVTYWWEDVVSVKGVSFLKFHFEGIGQIQRDLRGLRPEDQAKADKAAKKWSEDMLRSIYDPRASYIVLPPTV